MKHLLVTHINAYVKKLRPKPSAGLRGQGSTRIYSLGSPKPSPVSPAASSSDKEDLVPGPAALTLEAWLGTHGSAERSSPLLGESQFLSKTCNNCAIITLSSQLPLSQEEPLKQSNEHLLRVFTIKLQKTTRGDENP